MQNNDLPFNLESEQALLGCILAKMEILPRIKDRISIDDFYLDKHKEIYRAILHPDSKDMISAWNLVDKSKNVDRDYFFDLLEITIPASWEYYIEIVKTNSKKRQLCKLGLMIKEESSLQYSNIEGVLSLAKTGIHTIEKSDYQEIETNEKLYMRLYNHIHEKKAPGLYTGIDGIESNFYFEPGYIHCIAAESNVGKSALMIQIADYIAKTYDKKVPYFSLESTRERLGLRQLARYSYVSLTRINKNNFTGPDQEEKIQKAIDRLCESNLVFFDDSKYYEIERLTSFVESFILRNNTAAIFVDYLQAAQSTKKNLQKKDKVENTLYQLKRLAKNINIPVIYASQLRKDIQGRPSVDDLYESNEIRQATDNILFMYSPSPRKDRPAKYPVELYLDKGKEQELFSIWQEFDGNFQKFSWCEEPKELTRRKRKDIEL